MATGLRIQWQYYPQGGCKTSRKMWNGYNSKPLLVVRFQIWRFMECGGVPSFPFLPSPLSPKVIVPVNIFFKSQIDLFTNYLHLIVVFDIISSWVKKTLETKQKCTYKCTKFPNQLKYNSPRGDVMPLKKQSMICKYKYFTYLSTRDHFLIGV